MGRGCFIKTSTFFLSSRARKCQGTPLASARGDKKESDSEASLASLGTVSLTSFGTASPGGLLTFKFFILPSIKIYRKQKRKNKKQKEVQPWR